MTTATPARTGLFGGIVLIVLAVFLLSLSDALAKLFAADLSVAQLFVVRSLIACALIASVAAFAGRSLTMKAPIWVMLRSLLLATMWACYYSALPAMSFTLAAAALYTSPVMMAVFSSLLLNERLGTRRWLAIGLGMAGVVIALRPDVATLEPVATLPFAAAACYALAAIVTWSRCGEETPRAMAFALNVALAALGGLAIAVLWLVDPSPAAIAANPFVLDAWPEINIREWALLALLGLFMTVIATAVASAYQRAPSPIVGVFDNSYLAFAALWGAVFFDEIPDTRGALGITLIAAAAVLTSLPDRQAPKA